MMLATSCAQPTTETRPATYKVEGKVVRKDGKPYTEGGVIEFVPDPTKGVRSLGQINPDGTFSLHTVTAQHRVEGATAGPHTVTVSPPAPDQNVRTFVLTKKYTVTPGENKMTVELED
jgi:hypothetical protein